MTDPNPIYIQLLAERAATETDTGPHPDDELSRDERRA